MVRFKAGLIVLLVACCCTGCASRVYAPETASEAQALKIRLGDEVRVVTTNRDRMTFEVTQILDDRFAGVTVEPNAKETRPAGVAVEIPYAEVAMIQVRTCNCSMPWNR